MSRSLEPPLPTPEGRIVRVPGRGEFFVRDSGGSAPAVLLLHGWMVSADLNWIRTYEALESAGYRVLAMDHRGHGRGLRSPHPFRLADCAADAAAVVRELEAGPVLATGYSLGGPVAQLMARDHRDAVAGIVLCATATDWSHPRMKALWNSMSGLRLGLGLFPQGSWQAGLRLAGYTANRAWASAELSRGSARDVAEAGRELGRFDSRPWIAGLDLPAAVVVTTEDTAVPPRKQRRLAERLGVPAFEVRGDHGAVIGRSREFNRALLDALGTVAEQREDLKAA